MGLAPGDLEHVKGILGSKQAMILGFEPLALTSCGLNL